MNVDKSTISEYMNEIKLQAEDLVLNKFPRRFLELGELLKTVNFTNNDIISAHSKRDSDGNIKSDDATDNASKKQKLDFGITAASSSNACTSEQIITCNNSVTDSVELIKPRIHQFLEDTQLLKMWIQYLTPRNEFATDSTKSILEDIFNEILAAETDAEAFSKKITEYFLARGGIIAKIVKYPQLDDYRKAVKEMDGNFHRQIQETLCNMRDDYAAFYDMILKNLEKMKKPRNFDPSVMY